MKIKVVEILISKCQRGDILVATHRNLRAGYHPIIFFDHLNQRDFIGCMLTHKVMDKNVPMLKNHFLETSAEFEFENTQLVKGKFIKFTEWKPFYKVGTLSESGIEFVERIVSNLPLETFSKYYRRQIIPNYS